MDGQGFAELVIGNVVYTLEHDGGGNPVLHDAFAGNSAEGRGRGLGGVICIADCTGGETDPEEVAYCNGELVVVWDGRFNPGLSPACPGWPTVPANDTVSAASINPLRTPPAVACSTDSGFCSENQDALYNNGIEVWGDTDGIWGDTRGAWNQYAYHVDNIGGGGVELPFPEPASWMIHNSWRANVSTTPAAVPSSSWPNMTVLVTLLLITAHAAAGPLRR